MSFPGTVNPNKTYNQTEYAGKIAKQTGLALGLYDAYKQPDVVVGIVPLYNAKLIEGATSQDVLKYRSTGQQFLAHQKGGNYALKIDAKLSSIQTLLTTLTALQWIHAYGEGQQIPNVANITSSTIYQISGNLVPSNKSELQTLDKSKVSKSGKKILKQTYTSIDDWDWMTCEWFKTFPIISDDTIYHNMYIETIVYWRTPNDDDGKTINLSILCRKFIPPPVIEWITDGAYYSKYNIEMRQTEVPVPLNEKGNEYDSVIISVDEGNKTETADSATDRELHATLKKHGSLMINKAVSVPIPSTKRFIRSTSRIPSTADVIELIANTARRGGNAIFKEINYIDRVYNGFATDNRYRDFYHNGGFKLVNLFEGQLFNKEEPDIEHNVSTGDTEIKVIDLDDSEVWYTTTSYLEQHNSYDISVGKGTRTYTDFVTPLMFKFNHNKFKSLYKVHLYGTANTYYSRTINGIKYVFYYDIYDGYTFNIWIHGGDGRFQAQ